MQIVPEYLCPTVYKGVQEKHIVPFGTGDIKKFDIGNFYFLEV